MVRLDEAGLLAVLGALSHPHRLRVVARLREGPGYVSQLARDLGVSRPLLHMHLEKLEEAGLVRGHLELSPEGKALKVFELAPFHVDLTPETISRALESRDDRPADPSPTPGEPR